MKWLLGPDNDLTLDGGLALIGAVRPVINGRPLRPLQVAVIDDGPARLELRYTAEGLHTCCFGLELSEGSGGDQIWLRYWLQDLPDDLVLDSFGLQFAAITNLRAYLRQGYTSWDGSLYVQPEAMDDFAPDEPRPETGYAMTQILPRYGRGGLVIGFDRHDRLQQTFTFDIRLQPCSLTVQTLWDRKERADLARCESERLVVFTHPEVEAGLREWARLVAATSPWPPRLPDQPLTGWCSWYNLYAAITEENILEHLQGAADVARLENLQMHLFQIDDGFTPEMGDWLDVKPQFPRGMRPMLDDIRAAGFIPGLWIAPFVVGKRSRLFRQHPDWVVIDRQTNNPLIQMEFYGEFRWHKRSEEYYILDTTHPEAFDYLRQVFRRWRREWDCGYFKTDFMHFGSEHGPDRVRRHRPGLTRIEIWRNLAEMIREEIGDALWLGCGCPLWASVGLVDAVRTGRDVGVTWQQGRPAQALLRDQATRNFANHILWRGDPDCVLLRERFHYLTEAEIRCLALYAGLAGGVIMTSDQMSELPAKRLRLWRLLLSGTQSGCDFPLLGQSEIVYRRIESGAEVGHEPQVRDPMLVQVRRPRPGHEAGAIFLFNTGQQPIQRTYQLAGLGIAEPVYLFDRVEQRSLARPVSRISLTLAAHDGRLFFFGSDPVEPMLFD